jgi:hypothetical protein
MDEIPAQGVALAIIVEGDGADGLGLEIRGNQSHV